MPVKTHEDVTKAIVEGRLELDLESGMLRKCKWRGRLRECLNEAGFEPLRIKHILSKKEGYRSQMISSSLDVDRSDYLLRDCFFTGATFSFSDPGLISRLWSNFTIHQNSLLLRGSEDAIRVANHFLVARATLYSEVYMREEVRMANALLTRAIESYYQDKKKTEKRSAYLGLFGKTDDQLFCELEGSDDSVTRRLMRNIRYGLLYEVARQGGFGLSEIDGDVKNIIEGASKAEQLIGKNRHAVLRSIEKTAEEEVSRRVGVDANEHKIIVDIPEYPLLEEADTLVLKEDHNSVVARLQDMSPSYFKAAYEDMTRAWSIHVFTSRDLIPEESRIRNCLSDLF